MSVLAIANPKGGVGKTITAVNVAACAAGRGVATLLVDCDPQGHASIAVGYDLPPDEPGTSGLIHHASLSDLVQTAPSAPGLDLVAADLRLEIAARDAEDELWLARALGPARARWGLIVLDTAPGLGPLTRAALLAADSCLVPVAGGALGALTAQRFLDTLPRLTADLGHELDVHAVFTRFRRQNASRDGRAALHALGASYLDGNIREAAIIEKSITERTPVVILRPSSGPARDLTKLTAELITREQQRG